MLQREPLVARCVDTDGISPCQSQSLHWYQFSVRFLLSCVSPFSFFTPFPFRRSALDHLAPRYARRARGAMAAGGHRRRSRTPAECTLLISLVRALLSWSQYLFCPLFAIFISLAQRAHSRLSFHRRVCDRAFGFTSRTCAQLSATRTVSQHIHTGKNDIFSFSFRCFSCFRGARGACIRRTQV